MKLFLKGILIFIAGLFVSCLTVAIFSASNRSTPVTSSIYISGIWAVVGSVLFLSAIVATSSHEIIKAIKENKKN